LECKDGRLYTGIATDPERRFEEHKNGKRGAKFTRANPPVRLLAAEPVEGRSAAQQLEARVKKLDRQQKLVWAGLWQP
ncbi:MAG TPA: GIY-YIG nuclease family protein, partial [Gammaproteobacteria bacterium]|nr:GIY-YIG nuclease family protein [Gammaproteobacteria bacterium]